MSAMFVEEIEAMGKKMEAEHGMRFGISASTAPFWEAFDDDQTLMYDPDTTAAIVMSELWTQRGCS